MINARLKLRPNIIILSSLNLNKSHIKPTDTINPATLLSNWPRKLGNMTSNPIVPPIPIIRNAPNMVNNTDISEPKKNWFIESLISSMNFRGLGEMELRLFGGRGFACIMFSFLWEVF